MTTKMKNIVAALSTIVLFTTASFAANTNTDSLQASTTVNEPLSVSFVGEEGNYLVFEVALTSSATAPTSFAVSDKLEGELYTTRVSADKKQTLKIEKRDNQILDFTLSVGKEVFSKSFIMVPTVVVTKVK
jgi:hypothetical protein